MVAGEDVGGDPVHPRRLPALDRAEAHRQVLQPAERARRLGLGVDPRSQAGGEGGVGRADRGRDEAHGVRPRMSRRGPARPGLQAASTP